MLSCPQLIRIIFGKAPPKRTLIFVLKSIMLTSLIASRR